MSETSLSPNQKAWAAFNRNRPALVSLCFLLGLTLIVLIWPKIAPYPSDKVTEEQFRAPSSSHWFGTDIHGRDLFTRVFFGARVSLLVGIVGAGVALVIGVSWGSIAGYVGGKWDSFMMRFVDILYSLPSILCVIVLVATFNDLVRRII